MYVYYYVRRACHCVSLSDTLATALVSCSVGVVCRCPGKDQCVLATREVNIAPGNLLLLSSISRLELQLTDFQRLYSVVFHYKLTCYLLKFIIVLTLRNSVVLPRWA